LEKGVLLQISLSPYPTQLSEAISGTIKKRLFLYFFTKMQKRKLVPEKIKPCLQQTTLKEKDGRSTEKA
jgi:hypothetical protein